MATWEQFDGVMENAYGKKLETPIKFEGKFEKLADIAEVRSVNEYPKESEITDFVNNRRKANARQKAMQQALDDAKIVKPTLETDPQLRLRKMYDVLVSNKMSENEARAVASSTLGIAWE